MDSRKIVKCLKNKEISAELLQNGGDFYGGALRREIGISWCRRPLATEDNMPGCIEEKFSVLPIFVSENVIFIFLIYRLGCQKVINLRYFIKFVP